MKNPLAALTLCSESAHLCVLNSEGNVNQGILRILENRINWRAGIFHLFPPRWNTCSNFGDVVSCLSETGHGGESLRIAGDLWTLKIHKDDYRTVCFIKCSCRWWWIRMDIYVFRRKKMLFSIRQRENVATWTRRTLFQSRHCVSRWPSEMKSSIIFIYFFIF